jgi:mRNA degradation ribonuclease J1/J2
MAKQPKLRIIPLGGLGEIGKNMTVFELGNDAFILDTGIMFPANDMLGIDYIIPDFNYLLERPDLQVRGIIVTHGHEDHTGAIQHVAAKIPAPIYATPLTRGLLEVKLKQAKLLDQIEMVTFQAGDTPIPNLAPPKGGSQADREIQMQRLLRLNQEFRNFDFLSPWEGPGYSLPGDEKATSGKGT